MTYENSNQIERDESSPIKIRKKLGFGLITASLFFFFNPDISVIDFFPDIFGYILMSLGLSQLSLINEHIAEAYTKFRKMILVSAGKLAAVLFIFGMTDSANRPNSLLLFAFAFAVIELMFLIPAYGELFKGIQSLSDRYEGRVAYFRKRKDGLDYSEKIRIFTLVFVVLKSFSSTWPEFISLVTTEYTDSFVMYMYDYIGAFRIIAFIPTFIVGIVWISEASSFFKRLGKDTVMIENIHKAFVTDILPRKNLFIKRTINTVISILAVAAIFCIDFPLGSVGLAGDSAAEINILPDWIAAILFIVSAKMLSPYIEDTRKTHISSIVFLLFSLLASAMKVFFIVKFDYYTAINKIDEAYYLFYGMCGVTALENIAFVISVIMMSLSLREVIKKYTGYSAYSTPDKSERVTSLQKELTGKLKYMIIFSLLSGITAVMYEILLPEKHLLAQYMWLIDLIVQAIFAGSVLKCIYSVKDEVDNRFMLEM